MGIYPQAFQLAYVTNGASLNTNLNLNPGSYAVVVQEWDNCGGASTKTVNITVNSSTKTGVYVTSPANKSTVGSPVNFSATATSSCSLGVASMGIYTSPSKLAYVVNGASLNTNLTLSPGTYNTTVEEWDKCGGASTTPVTITVSSSGKTFTNLHSSGGWNWLCAATSHLRRLHELHSQRAGHYVGDVSEQEVTHNVRQLYPVRYRRQHELLRRAVEQPPDRRPLIAGIADTNHSLVQTLHTFTYDVYFCGAI